VDSLLARTRRAILLLAAALPAAAPASAQDRSLLTWRFHEDELAVESSLISRFANPITPDDLVLRHVTIVDLPEGTLSEDHAVIVRAGKITWVGADAQLDLPSGYRVIDGSGRFLLPGLVDMHVHTLVTTANYLTQLGAGVTTIREMDGFPWLLARKRQAERGEILAPSMFVTGQILNANDLGGFARGVTTPEDARTAVREQAADGYDAIKIHNALTVELFDAIIDEANAVGLDVVGHNPQRVPVEHAIRKGLRTAEHFKGYIDDATLTLSDVDWVGPSRDSDIYLTPTFHTYRDHLRGEEALTILKGSEAKLVHPHLRAQWQRAAGQPVTELTRLRQSILPMSKKIFQTLLPHGITDSGGYLFMVPGLALLDELETMEAFGLSPLETLKAATTNAAAAMRWSDRVGRVAPGLQADLLLTRDNPLETVRNLRSLESIVLRGTWIPAARELLTRPSQVWSGSETPQQAPSRQDVAAHLTARKRLRAHGYAFSHFVLAEMKDLIAGFGYEDLAQDVDGLVYTP
jgi:imidazolonepropionase-like amidohydrolase